MKTLTLTAILLLPAVVGAQNNLPATPNPTNLGEAAGLYAGSVAHLQAVKSSTCGYAITRSLPTIQSAIRSEIAPLFPQEQRTEVARLLASLEPDMRSQGESTLASTYNHYIRQEGLDHNTACGFVAGAALTMRKLAYEAMVKKAASPSGPWSLDWP